MWAEEKVRKGTFPKNLKNEDMTSILEKNSYFLAKNYRPASVSQQFLKYLKE